MEKIALIAFVLAAVTVVNADGPIRARLGHAKWVASPVAAPPVPSATSSTPPRNDARTALRIPRRERDRGG